MDKIIQRYSKAVLYAAIFIMIGAMVIFACAYKSVESVSTAIKSNTEANNRNLNYIYQNTKLLNRIVRNGSPQVKMLLDEHYTDSIKILDLQNTVNQIKKGWIRQ